MLLLRERQSVLMHFFILKDAKILGVPQKLWYAL